MCTSKEANFHGVIKIRDKMIDLNYVNPMQSGFDYGDWPVIKENAELEMMEWGLAPSYIQSRESLERFRKGYTDYKGKYHPPMTTLNAKGEELLLPNKMYRNAALERRCLFALTGFYEWRHIPQIGKKGQVLKATKKYPYYIKVKCKPYFFVAGIWQPFTDYKTGEVKHTAASITTKANELMAQIHNSQKRQPTILTDALAEEWISKDLSEERIKEIATYQIPSDQLEAYTINRDYRNASDPREHVEYPELPPLHL